jgi:serralysin
MEDAMARIRTLGDALITESSDIAFEGASSFDVGINIDPVIAPTDDMDSSSLDFGISGDPVIAPTGGSKYAFDFDFEATGYNKIIGTDKDDTGLFGTSDKDFIVGLPGNDCLYGNAGDDLLIGGEGADVMVGGTGNDFYEVDGGDVVFEWGGEGHDTIYVVRYADNSFYQLPSGVEDLVLMQMPISRPINEREESWPGVHDVFGGVGNELDNSITGNYEANILSGEAGNDKLYGLWGNDDLSGGDGNDRLEGEGGMDILQGGSGNDIMLGGEEADDMQGGLGNDVLDGGTGDDVMDGGIGNDTYYVDSYNDRIFDFVGTDHVYSSLNYELPIGIESLALLPGSAIYGYGNELDNTITGNELDNFLGGFAGQDTLSGGNGRDVLVGGTGQDVLWGEMGADTFHFATMEECGLYRSSADQIADFAAGYGSSYGEKIDLSLIDADATAAGNQTFAFIGTNAEYTGVAGQLRFTSDGYVEGDVNGDAVSDFFIQVSNVTSMQDYMFVL